MNRAVHTVHLHDDLVTVTPPDLDQVAADRIAQSLTGILRAAPRTMAALIDARIRIDAGEVEFFRAHPQVQVLEHQPGVVSVGVLGLLQAAMPDGWLLVWFRPTETTVALLNGRFENVNVGQFRAVRAGDSIDEAIAAVRDEVLSGP